MSSTVPKITVLLPTYNAVEYIEETIDSVLRQRNCPPFEVVVTDDHSSDGTRDIVRSYSDERLTLIERDNNLGIAGNTNRAINVASGELVAFIDHDDVWKPEKLACHYRRHKKTGSALVYSDLSYINSEGEWIEDRQLPEPNAAGTALVNQLFEYSNFIPTLSCVSVRKDVWDVLDGFDRSLSVSCDFDFYVKVAADHDFARVSETLTSRRIHTKNVAHQYEAIYQDKSEIYNRYSDLVDSHSTNMYLGVMNRSRASWEFQSGHSRRAIRFLKESLKHDVSVKGLLLGILIFVDILSGPLSAGNRVYDYYLDHTARRRQ